MSETNSVSVISQSSIKPVNRDTLSGGEQDCLTDQAKKYINAYPPNQIKVENIVSWISQEQGLTDKVIVDNETVRKAVNHTLGLAETQALQGHIGFSGVENAEDYLAAARQLAHQIGEIVPLDAQLEIIETGELARVWKGISDEIPDESQPLTDELGRSIIGRVRSTLQRVGEIKHIRHALRNRERDTKEL